MACRTEKFTGMMIYAKSGVAPLKSVTVPRLELNAARLSGRVAEELRREAGFLFTRPTYWTDSTIVLHYVRNTATRYNTFVANGISTIHQLSSHGDWRHVTSENNPADLASALRYWLKEPSFLESSEAQWPPYEPNFIPEGIELKGKYALVNVTTCTSEPTGLYHLMERYSDWSKLLKSVVWFTRFKAYLRMMATESSLKSGGLNLAEVRQAERDIIHEAKKAVNPEIMLKLECTGGLMKELHVTTN
ncbi:hypothetical protein CRM22_009267 [Opisthorchis felineus]|uniref:Uncharacterized protein n=1 Tax=Opisthorchis felineus TaxID=147828 RepID=A0A4S2L7L7_OPIFE|nr:hypothetical protein CRM22_009267 [Opisthorchis felineus]